MQAATRRTTSPASQRRTRTPKPYLCVGVMEREKWSLRDGEESIRGGKIPPPLEPAPPLTPIGTPVTPNLLRAGGPGPSGPGPMAARRGPPDPTAEEKHFLMQQQTVVNDSDFLKYSWAHVAIFNTTAWRFLMQRHLRAQRSSTFNWGFLPCPICTVISLDSLNLFKILCMILGERPKFFAICIAKCDFWFAWHFSCEIWHKVMSHDPALLAKSEMLLLYPNMIPLPIIKSPAYWKLFQNSLTWIFYNLFTFILPLSQLFWNVLQPSISFFFIFTKYIYVGQWKLWKSFLCTFVN